GRAGIVGRMANGHYGGTDLPSDVERHAPWRTRTMLSRRKLLTGTVGAGLALTAGYPRRAAAQTPAADLERNKEVVRRLKESQGTKDEAAVQRELTVPGA